VASEQPAAENGTTRLSETWWRVTRLGRIGQAMCASSEFTRAMLIDVLTNP
jgi:hypothetical protein